MKKLMLLLVTACSFLSACATQETTVPPYGEARSVSGGLCPPSQAIKGLC